MPSKSSSRLDRPHRNLSLSPRTHPPLLKEAFVSEIRRALETAGLNPALYAGHSFRIGAATSAAAAGILAHMIQTLGRWSSDAFKLYIRASRDSLAQVSATLASLTLTAALSDICYLLCPCLRASIPCSIILIIYLSEYLATLAAPPPPHFNLKLSLSICITCYGSPASACTPPTHYSFTFPKFRGDYFMGDFLGHTPFLAFGYGV